MAFNNFNKFENFDYEKFKKGQQGTLSSLYPLILSNIEQDTYFMEFLKRNKSSSKWMIYSDYCLDRMSYKNHFVLTFSIFPYSDTHQLNFYKNVLEKLYNKDIKHSPSRTSQKFVDFVKFFSNLPIFNFSVLLEKDFNFFSTTEMTLQEYFKNRFEGMRINYSKQYAGEVYRFSNAIYNMKACINALNTRKKVDSFVDLEITTVIVTCLIKSIADITCHKNTIGWCSDTDKIIEFLKGKSKSPIIFDMVFHDFNSIANSTDQDFIFICNNDKGFDHAIRIPDFIAGTLSDMSTTEVSLPKFLPVIYECLVNKKSNSIIKLVNDSSGRAELRIFDISSSKKIEFNWRDYQKTRKSQ